MHMLKQGNSGHKGQHQSIRGITKNRHTKIYRAYLSKKSQMEILGLAIVVVLLILGFIFVVKFIALKKPGTLKKEVVESQVASSFISTYLSTSVEECSGLTATELLQDCATQGGISCQDHVGSCDKAREVAAAIFSGTFEQWKWKYEMTASLSGRPAIMQLGTSCSGQKRSKTFPLPTKAGTLIVKLDICG